MSVTFVLLAAERQRWCGPQIDADASSRDTPRLAPFRRAGTRHANGHISLCRNTIFAIMFYR